MVKLRVRQLLKERGHDMAWLARETGRSYQAIHAATKDQIKSVRFETLELLCRAFECDPGDLLEREIDPSTKSARKKS